MAIRDLSSGNPLFRAQAFENARVGAGAMSVAGTINRAGFLILLLLVSAFFVWQKFFELFYAQENPQAAMAAVMPWMIGGIVGGLILALVIIFAKTTAPYVAWLYALCEGLAIGGISAIFQAQYAGIVIQAVALTFGVLSTMLVLYGFGIIRATEKFRAIVFACTGGIALVYVVTLLLGFFGTTVPYIHGSGPIGIGFSLFVVAIAALNLIVDFDNIERGAKHGAPKYMEWYCAFGLLVTLVWLYLEILRLLAKLKRR